MNNELTLATPKTVKCRRILAILGVVAVMMVMMVCTAFADDTANAIQNGVINATGSLYSILKAIVIPIGAVVFAWNGIKALFGGERGMEQAKKNMLVIIIVMVIVFAGPAIVNQIGTWFNGTGDAGVFDTV